MKLRVFFISLLFSVSSLAGVDLTSTIERVQLKGDGKLWLKMTNSAFDTYCKPSWHGFNLYIPETDPSYPYYYGLIASALTQNQSVFIANISYFDGTTTCDITKTGYGIVVSRNH
tara:strand:+ start:3890 stop:4234 length:345 start_codon:yes stop_codon:yes gene_type:complete